MYKVQRVTEPEVEPITLEFAKEQLRIEQGFTMDDNLIEAQIASARDEAEKYCNRAFAKADFFLLLPNFPAGRNPLWLHDPSTSEVSEITYLDAENNEQTLDPADYTFDADRQHIRSDDYWPQRASSVKIRYTAGYDRSASPPELIPRSVEQGMLLLITDMYETRTAQLTGTIIQSNPAATMRLSLHRVDMGV